MSKVSKLLEIYDDACDGSNPHITLSELMDCLGKIIDAIHCGDGYTMDKVLTQAEIIYNESGSFMAVLKSAQIAYDMILAWDAKAEARAKAEVMG